MKSRSRLRQPRKSFRTCVRGLSLHGWHYIIEDGEVHVFDVHRGGFVPAAQASNAGTGPYLFESAEDGMDASGIPSA